MVKLTNEDIKWRMIRVRFRFFILKEAAAAARDSEDSRVEANEKPGNAPEC
jgi:hypothetical protein